MTKKIKDSDQIKARDPDLANAEVALKRAAIRAREIAVRTGTSVVYSINGNIIKENPAEKPDYKNKPHGS